MRKLLRERAWLWVFVALAAVAAALVGGTLIPQLQTSSVHPARTLAATVFVTWVGLIVAYYVWAIRRYTVNHGLSDEEWKVLYPDLYAGEHERDSYRRRHDELVARAAAAAEAGIGAGQNGAAAALVAPASNPYKKDSFGLPPGTVRGTLALTALVMFVAIETVNLFVPDTEGRFEQLVTAFMMVLAFYFGSRAVEVLRERKGRGAAGAAGDAREAPSARAAAGAPAGAPATAANEVAPPPPSEVPALPPHVTPARLATIETGLPVVLAKSSPAASAGLLDERDPLETRVLALTAAFETGLGFPACFGAVAGDFDGQGLSYGALQWNVGKRTLPPLLQRMRAEHDGVLRAALGPLYGELARFLDADPAGQLAWARSIQVRREGRAPVVIEGWRRALGDLGRTPEMIRIQVEQARTRFETALARCDEYGLASERGAALMFDINVQNGAVDVRGVGATIREDYERIPPGLSAEDEELERLVVVATRRANASLPQWRQDVLRRKLTIARGAGVVHKRRFDLEREFGIALHRKSDGTPMQQPQRAAAPATV